MGNRKTPYKPKLFESTGRSNDTSANIYDSMLVSPAFKALTKGQRLLYVYMKKMYYGHRRPIKDDPLSFTFNQCKWIKDKKHTNKYGFELYSNKNQFYKDRDALVNHGFIEIVENNKNQRESNIYRFSDKWRTWQPKPP